MKNRAEINNFQNKIEYFGGSKGKALRTFSNRFKIA